jgi:signal transduction histidine kinase
VESTEPGPAPRDGRKGRPDRAALLSRLARGLAHEIKNPLSTMSINLALLQEDWERAAHARNPSAPELSPREERSLRRTKTLQREVARLESILDSFLHYARGEEVDRNPQDIGALVRDLLDFVEPEYEREGIRQHVEIQAGLPLVLMDESQIRQAVLNLLVNARQAMPDGGELLVRVRRDGNDAEVSVTDTGVGMTPEQVERCFEEYWSTKKSGTGLGLATTRRIVEEHGGRISVVSDAGRGTSFAVHLPLAVELFGSSYEEDES